MCRVAPPASESTACTLVVVVRAVAAAVTAHHLYPRRPTCTLLPSALLPSAPPPHLHPHLKCFKLKNAPPASTQPSDPSPAYTRTCSAASLATSASSAAACARASASSRSPACWDRPSASWLSRRLTCGGTAQGAAHGMAPQGMVRHSTAQADAAWPHSWQGGGIDNKHSGGRLLVN